MASRSTTSERQEAIFRARRISVVGVSGAGKSTLAQRLAGLIDGDWIELDSLYHQPGWRALENHAFCAAVLSRVEAPRWVVDGNYSAVRPLVLERAELVIWLDPERGALMRQLLGRTLRRLISRQVLWNDNRERFGNLLSWSPNRSILRWAWTRHGVYRQRYRQEQARLAGQGGIAFIRLGSRAEADAFCVRFEAARRR